VSPDVAASVRARLLNQAKRSGEEFERTLARFGAERLLYRLGACPARDRCLLKGASLLAVWLPDPYRATRDVDVLASGATDDEAIQLLVAEICDVPCPEDGLRFDLSELTIETIRPEDEYSGKRARFRAFLGNARIAVQLDIGIGDAVVIPPEEIAYGVTPEELETLSRIIAELNERFGLNLGPEHRVTLGQMMEKLDDDAALDAAARVNTRENVRLTFDQKVEHVIQEIVDSNFDLYKRITDDRVFGETVKNFLFDQYLRAHRNAEELIKAGESKTLEFKSTLRWSLKEDRQDDKGVTHAVLKTIAAFLNTEGGDLLIGVADDGAIVGIEKDQLDSDDKFMRHLAQVVRNGLGDRSGTCIDPKTQIVQGKTVCLVSCQRSPEPVFLKWKGVEATPDGDFFVRSGPGTVKLGADSAREYIRTRFPGLNGV
jgi:hypothetical protein